MEQAVARIEHADLLAVRAELDRQWGLVRNDPETRNIVASMGIDLDALDTFASNPFDAEPLNQGNRADIATTILVGIAVKIGTDIGVKALQALWDKVVRVQIEKRFGKSAAVGTKEAQTG